MPCALTEPIAAIATHKSENVYVKSLFIILLFFDISIRGAKIANFLDMHVEFIKYHIGINISRNREKFVTL